MEFRDEFCNEICVTVNGVCLRGLAIFCGSVLGIGDFDFVVNGGNELCSNGDERFWLFDGIGGVRDVVDGNGSVWCDKGGDDKTDCDKSGLNGKFDRDGAKGKLDRFDSKLVLTGIFFILSKLILRRND